MKGLTEGLAPFLDPLNTTVVRWLPSLAIIVGVWIAFELAGIKEEIKKAREGDYVARSSVVYEKADDELRGRLAVLERKITRLDCGNEEERRVAEPRHTS
jgi:hypothetical protein